VQALDALPHIPPRGSTGLTGVYVHTPSRVAPPVGRHQLNTARHTAPLKYLQGTRLSCKAYLLPLFFFFSLASAASTATASGSGGANAWIRVRVRVGVRVRVRVEDT